MGGNNSKWNNWQRINLQNTQAAHAAQYQKNEQPSQKVGRKKKKKWAENIAILLADPLCPIIFSLFS